MDIADAGVVIRTCNGGDIDLSNSTGKMMARILGSVAQQESEHKGERHRAANRRRREQGVWRADGPRNFGYTQRGEPLEPEATALCHAVRDILAGRSLRSVCAEWNRRGLLTPKGQPRADGRPPRGGVQWTNPQLRRTLMRPVYAGLCTYTDGKGARREVAGDWTPLVDADTWRGLVAFLSDESRTPAAAFERRHLLSGVAVCGVCGARLYSAGPGYGHRPRPRVYVCRESSGAHVGRLADPLDELIEATVLELLQRNDIAARLADRDGVDVDGLHARRAALAAKKDELATLLAEGVLDVAGVRRESHKLAALIADINTALAEHARTSPAADMLADGVDRLAEHWEAASPDIRGKVVEDLMTVNVLPTPPGVRGISVSRETGARVVNLDYVDIQPKL